MDYFRKISIKILFPVFYRSGLSANKITVLNFLLLGLGSVALFLTGRDILGLLTAGLMAAIDYIDGTVARARGGNTKLGQYLDTSLDWLYLMMLIGSLSYAHTILPWGYVILICLTFGNWVQYNGNVEPPFRTFIVPLLVIGIFFNCLTTTIPVLAGILTARTLNMYWRSIEQNLTTKLPGTNVE